MNKKGLMSGLWTVLLTLFFLALIGFVVVVGQKYLSESVEQLISSGAAQNSTHEDLRRAANVPLYFDRLYAFIFVLVIIAYIISSVTLPAERPIYFLYFAGFLIMATLIGMLLSNGWYYLINQEGADFTYAAANLTFTTFIMRYLPIIATVIGIFGAILFYGRTRNATGDTAYE